MEDIIINNLDYPILTASTFFPLAGAFIMLFLKRGPFIKWFALATTVATFIVSLPIYKHFDKTTYKMQFVEIHSWIPAWNIYYKVGVDGISVLFIILVALLSILCVSVSWKAKVYADQRSLEEAQNEVSAVSVDEALKRFNDELGESFVSLDDHRLQAALTQRWSGYVA